MSDQQPVDTIRATFVDDLVADEVAAALNVWFRWIVGGEETSVPGVFEAFGVDSAEYAWAMDDDVDWSIGPHARPIGTEVRIALETHDTWQRLSGLLKQLGAVTVKVERQEAI